MAPQRMRVLVINLGWEQTPLIDRLAAMEVDLYGAHGSEEVAGRERFADVWHGDLRDLPGLMAFAERVQPDAAVSDQCDYSYVAQALVAERFGLPGPRLQEAQVATNKWLQRRRARDVADATGARVPAFQLCASIEEARGAAEQVGYPVVVKPIDNRGSFGVNRVDTPAALPAAVVEAVLHSHSRLVLVEAFIAGVHLTVDGYCFPEAGCRSLALATKGLTGGARQVALDIEYPGRLDAERYAAAMACNERVNTALGFRFGMTHSEYMLTDEGDLYLIESANRGGGVYTSELIVPAVSGIDLVGQLIADALGRADAPGYRPPDRRPTILRFFALPPGRVEQVEGLDALREAPDVLAARLFVEPGDTIQPITTDANRHGFAIFTGADRAAVRARADAVLDTLTITYAD